MNDVSRSFRGNSNAARDIAHHLHPYTNFKKHEESGPLTIVRGRGIYVTDDDGKEYIEGMAGLWSAALGFSNERLATVAYEQMKQIGSAAGVATPGAAAPMAGTPAAGQLVVRAVFDLILPESS